MKPVMAEQQVPARAESFGDEPTRGHVHVIARTSGWRVSHATPPLVIGLLLAPVLFIVPPHVPWALGAVGVGVLLAVRKWNERLTLTRVAVPCPHCGQPLPRTGPVALRQPHSLSCDACHHHVTLIVRPSALEAPAAGDG